MTTPIETLTRALEPFARIADVYERVHSELDHSQIVSTTLGLCLRAREALAATQEQCGSPGQETASFGKRLRDFAGKLVGEAFVANLHNMDGSGPREVQTLADKFEREILDFMLDEKIRSVPKGTIDKSNSIAPDNSPGQEERQWIIELIQKELDVYWENDCGRAADAILARFSLRTPAPTVSPGNVEGWREGIEAAAKIADEYAKDDVRCMRVAARLIARTIRALPAPPSTEPPPPITRPSDPGYRIGGDEDGKRGSDNG